MKWPLHIETPDGAEISGSIYGKHITMRRRGDSLALEFADERWTVGLPVGTHEVRVGPSLGSLPFLLFPNPHIIVPPGTEVVLGLTVPLHLDIAADAVRLHTIAPVGLMRALYGPVDNGTLCWSVRQEAPISTEYRLAGSAQQLSALVNITCDNLSTEPVEVTRVMIPTELIGLYEVKQALHTSDVTMTIIGEAEAELTMEPAAGGRSLHGVLGRPIAPVRRSFAFSHTYRNRTGLDYGF